MVLGYSNVINIIIVKITDGETLYCSIWASQIDFTAKAAITITKANVRAKSISAGSGCISKINVAIIIEVATIDLTWDTHSSR